jgi:hypothetical protein
MDGVRHLISRQPLHLGVRGSDERARIVACSECAGGLSNGRPDPRIGAAAAQVPAHPRVDRLVVRARIRLEQRDCCKRLPRLAVTALHDVAAVPGVAHRVDHRTRRSLDRRDGLAHRSLGRGLAGLHVAAVDQHRAGRAEPISAAELRAMQTKDVPEHPQQRGLGVPVVNLDFGAVDDKLHLGPPSTRTCGLSCTGRTIAPAQVSCPHRMMVILRRPHARAIYVGFAPCLSATRTIAGSLASRPPQAWRWAVIVWSTRNGWRVRGALPGAAVPTLMSAASGHAPVSPHGQRDEHGEEAGDPGDRAAE